MKKCMKIIKWTVAGFVVLLFLVVSINIVQNGGSYDGRKTEEILGKPAEKATLDDILRLSKKEFVQLFHSAKAPADTDMAHTFDAVNLPSGILAGSVTFYADHFFGPGKWTGKRFIPFKEGKGEGFNRFRKSTGEMVEARKMKTFVAASVFDEGDAYHLFYADFNGFPVSTMHDEIRKLNEDIRIGMGYMGIGGGSINPSPFILFNKRDE